MGGVLVLAVTVLLPVVPIAAAAAVSGGIIWIASNAHIPTVLVVALLALDVCALVIAAGVVTGRRTGRQPTVR